MMRIVRARITALAAPVQWEGDLADGRTFYLRNRHGVARLDVPYGTTVRSVDVLEFDGPHELAEFVQLFPELEIADDAEIDTFDAYIDRIEA